MRVALLGLALAGQRLDPFGSIPAMPTALPALAASLARAGARVEVVDGFGERPRRRFVPARGLVARGLTPAELAARVSPKVDLVGLSVHSVASDGLALETLRELRRRGAPPVVVGGAHPGLLPERFLEAGARWVVRGEGELALSRIAGLAGRQPAEGVVEGEPVEDLDSLPPPDFGVLPLRRYWDLGLGHGPVAGPHLDLSTSRGCAHGCRFCATPAIVRGRWRGASPGRVVWLLDRLHRLHGVRDFHFEDDDFSADPERVRRLCELLVRRGSPYRFALPSGVRAEPLDRATVRLLAAAGCRYLSLAPESGSARVLRAMGKRIDLERVAAVASEAVRSGIGVGCFLVLGYPGETPADRLATAELAERLVRLGVDDLSVFIWSPLPGAEAFGLERGWPRLEALCWTPRWRAGYPRLEGARVGVYLRALGALVRSRPLAVAASLGRVATGRHRTKGEMTARRILGWRA